MKLKNLCFLLLFFTKISFAQQRVLRGVIKDSLQQPLEYANVMATPYNSDLPFVFSLTNSKGAFDLHLAKKTAYTVTVSFMGFHNFSFKVDSLSTQINKNIVLRANTQIIDEVIVTSKTPMKVTKDSIVYDVDKFVTGREFKLKSVMKKLPGIIINKRGDITIMGEKVTQIFVDNKPFFGGSTKLALDNLPAHVIEKIQVIKDYNEVAFMKGLTDNQKLIINIKLKKGKKHFAFGDLEGGSDFDNKYIAKANVFYYAPKTNLSYIGNLNNTGENALSLSDIMRFDPIKLTKNTGVRSMNGGAIHSLISEKKSLNKKTFFNALQWQQDFGSKWKFNLFTVDTQKNIDYKEVAYNTYYTNPTNEEQITSVKNVYKKLNFTKLSVNYKPSFRQYFDYTLSLNNKVINTKKYIVNNYLSNQRDIDFSAYDSGFVFNQNFNWYKKFSKKHIVKLTTNLAFDTVNFDKSWLSSDPILENLIPLIPYTFYDIAQNQKITTNRFDFLLKHYYKVNAKNHLYFSIGNNRDVSSFWNDLEQQVNSAVNYPDFKNDFNLIKNDFYLGLQYRFKLWKSLWTPGIYLHQVQVNNSFTNQKEKEKLLLPKFDFELNTYGKIKLNYQTSLELPDIEKYSYNFSIKSFNSLYKGNEHISNVLYHKLKLYYSIGSMRYSFSFNANYNKKIQAIKNVYLLNNVNFYLSPINSIKVDELLDFGFTFSRTKKKFHLVYSPVFSFSTTYDYVGSSVLKVKNTFVIQRITLGTNLLKNTYFSLGLLYNFNKTTVANANSLKINQWSPFLNIDYSYKKINFNLDYKLQMLNAQTDTKNTYHFMNFSMRYGNDEKPYAVSLNALNLFDVNEVRAYSQNSYATKNTSTFLQSRIFLLKLHYRF